VRAIISDLDFTGYNPKNSDHAEKKLQLLSDKLKGL